MHAKVILANRKRAMMPDVQSERSVAWRRRVAGLAKEIDRAYLVAYRVSGSRALAEEAVQDAFVRLLAKPADDPGEAAAVARLLKGTHDAAVDLLRSSRARRQREESYAMNAARAQSLEPNSSPDELAHAARSALEQLDEPDERVAISLCCEQGLTRKDASEILGVPERTLSSRIERGLARLRQQLTAQGYAAVALPALIAALQSLGAPAAPAGLAQTIGRLAASGAGAAALSAPLKTGAGKHAAVSGWKAASLLLTVLIVAGAAGLVFWTGNVRRATAIPKAAQSSVPQAAAAPAPIPAVPETVMWTENFNDLAAWALTAWKPADHFDWELQRKEYRSAPACLRLAYTFPELPATPDADVWAANTRSIERAVTIAAGATQLRFSIKVLSARPDARLDIHLYDANDNVWEVNTRLEPLAVRGDGWQTVEYPLAHLSGYWSAKAGHMQDGAVPPLRSAEVAKILVGGNFGDFDVLLDDLEFIRRQ